MRKTAFVVLLGVGLLVVAGVLSHAGQEQSTPLGLPPVPIPEDNPQTPELITVGELRGPVFFSIPSETFSGESVKAFAGSWQVKQPTSPVVLNLVSL